MFVQHARITAVGAIFAQHVKTTPRRVRNYAAKSLAFSNAKRAALICKQKLRRANVETTPRNSYPVHCFPSFLGRTSAAEISYVELKYNNIPIGDGPGGETTPRPPHTNVPRSAVVVNTHVKNLRGRGRRAPPNDSSARSSPPPALPYPHPPFP